MAGELKDISLEALEEQLKINAELERRLRDQQNTIDELMAKAKETASKKKPEKRVLTRPTFTHEGTRYRWRHKAFINPKNADKVIAEDANKDKALRAQLMQDLPHCFEELGPAKSGSKSKSNESGEDEGGGNA